MTFSRIFLLSLLLQFCSSPSIENLEGILDPSFTQVNIAKATTRATPLKIDLAFNPNIFSIPDEASTNKYMISFSIKQSNFGNPLYYQHLNAFISLSNSGSISEPVYLYNGLLIRNCQDPCDSLFTAIKNQAGNDLTDINAGATITRNSNDGFFHLIIEIDPSHIGEAWDAIHGFPGSERGITQILYPFYRTKFNIER